MKIPLLRGFFGPFMSLGQLILAGRRALTRAQAERDPRRDRKPVLSDGSSGLEQIHALR
jgi:hypothetical protein